MSDLSELTITISTYDEFLNITNQLTALQMRFFWMDTAPTQSVTGSSSYSYGIAVRQSSAAVDFLFSSGVSAYIYAGRITSGEITTLRRIETASVI